MWMFSLGVNFIRSITFTTLTLNSGRFSFSICLAAKTSSVGVSPAHAKITSGFSSLAQDNISIPLFT